MTNSLKKIRS